MKARLKELTSRSNGMGYEQRKLQLTRYIRGWINYYKLADMKTHLQRVDEWYRRRLRMCICWKKVKTKFQDLMKCGIGQGKSWEWANTRKSYWRTSKSPMLTRAITNVRGGMGINPIPPTRFALGSTTFFTGSYLYPA
ncbi:MAG: group II intron maturase-specific domain-containing protein [Bacteroidales bacterium]